MSADFDLQHFGDPSEPGAPGHKAWLAREALAKLLYESAPEGGRQGIEWHEWEAHEAESGYTFVRDAYRKQADKVLAHTTQSTEPHSCESCQACLHDGHKCCGCYDGVCTQPTVQDHADRSTT